MFHKLILPMLAVVGLAYAGYRVWEMGKSPAPSVGRAEPPIRPLHARMLAGNGLVEAQKENIPIGTPVPGVVAEVLVSVREDRDQGLKRYVKKGDPLFIIDKRALEAEHLIRTAAVEAARSKLERLRHAPRQEDIPVAEASRSEALRAVEESQARVANAELTYSRSSRLVERNVATASEYDRDRYALAEARAGLARSEAMLAKADADYKRLMAGAWKEDIAVAEADLRQMEAALEANAIELDRLTVRAPSDGEVLKVNVRPGQFAAATWNEPMVVLGDLRKLHVRVDIDEHDLVDFSTDARAWATPRGDPKHRLELSFIKVEPYVTPKRSLTGDNTERVDTRVLQVIYALPDDRGVGVYVGQQMDVYIETMSGAASSPESAPSASPAP